MEEKERRGEGEGGGRVKSTKANRPFVLEDDDDCEVDKEEEEDEEEDEEDGEGDGEGKVGRSTGSVQRSKSWVRKQMDIIDEEEKGKKKGKEKEKDGKGEGGKEGGEEDKASKRKSFILFATKKNEKKGKGEEKKEKVSGEKEKKDEKGKEKGRGKGKEGDKEKERENDVDGRAEEESSGKKVSMSVGEDKGGDVALSVSQDAETLSFQSVQGIHFPCLVMDQNLSVTKGDHYLLFISPNMEVIAILKRYRHIHDLHLRLQSEFGDSFLLSPPPPPPLPSHSSLSSPPPSSIDFDIVLHSLYCARMEKYLNDVIEYLSKSVREREEGRERRVAILEDFLFASQEKNNFVEYLFF